VIDSHAFSLAVQQRKIYAGSMVAKLPGGLGASARLIRQIASKSSEERRLEACH